MSGKEGLLGRWSRLKREGGKLVTSRSEPEAATVVPDPATPEEEAALLERLGLPDPSTLAKGDDFAAFLQAQVPAALRRRALRALWRSDPVLAGLDGLVDYGEDFHAPPGGGALLKTVYEVGKGFTQPPSKEAENTNAPAVDPVPGEPCPRLESVDEPKAALEDNPQPIIEPEREASPNAPAPRRMVFLLEQ
jgi:hypothetical protein